jgi:hypothetical protein
MMIWLLSYLCCQLAITAGGGAGRRACVGGGDGAAEDPVDVGGDVGRIGTTGTVLGGEPQDGGRLAFVPVGEARMPQIVTATKQIGISVAT